MLSRSQKSYGEKRTRCERLLASEIAENGIKLEP